MEFSENMVMNDFLKQACKRFGYKDNYKQTKVYNKNGLQLFQDDFAMLNKGDCLYLALKGKPSLSDLFPTDRRGVQFQCYPRRV